MCHMLEHKRTLQFATSSNTVYPRNKRQLKCVVSVVIYSAKVFIPSSHSKMNMLKWNVFALNSAENLVKWPSRCTGYHKHSEKQWWVGSRYMTGNPIVRMAAFPLKIKKMLIVFNGTEGLVHHKFLAQGRRVTASDCLHKETAMPLRSSSLETASHMASATCFCLRTMHCAQWPWMSGTSWQSTAFQWFHICLTHIWHSVTYGCSPRWRSHRRGEDLKTYHRYNWIQDADVGHSKRSYHRCIEK
jgi:hypothetical protein